MPPKRKLKVIDCFCGAGGLSLGLKSAGLQNVYSFDNDIAAIETHSKNFNGIGSVKDITNLSGKSILKELGLKKGDIDVVAGGPPCQGFSVQRRGDDKDERNDLVLEFLRFCSEISPTFVVMENVSGILSKRGRLHFDKLKGGLSDLGYWVDFTKLRALDFGVPQDRVRVFLVAGKAPVSQEFFEWPRPNRKAPSTVRDAIWDIRNSPDNSIPNHKGDRLTDINIQRIRSLKPGEGRDSLPEHLQLPCHKNNNGHRHLDTYGRMSWDQPSPTITARFDSFSRGRFGHPENDRTITLREGARIQTFPDSFVFSGTKVQVARQIGNAVPPLLAEKLGRQLVRCYESSIK